MDSFSESNARRSKQEEVLRTSSYAEEFRNRKRRGLWAYIAAEVHQCAATIVIESEAFGKISTRQLQATYPKAAPSSPRWSGRLRCRSFPGRSGKSRSFALPRS